MIILTQHGEASRIARIFNVSDRTVRDALKYRTNSELARRIRECAKHRGGVETQSEPNQKIV